MLRNADVDYRELCNCCDVT